MEIVARTPIDIPKAYSLYYSKMAEYFASLIRPAHPRVILEAGCGKGQLTIPLLERLPRTTSLLGVDSSRGPYSGWLKEAQAEISRLNLANRVRLIRTSASRMGHIRTRSVDVIVSNELLCDLVNEEQLDTTLAEFSRVLRPQGLMVHGEWSSYPDNETKSLIARHRPSWSPDQLFSHMRKAGFVEFQASYFDTTIKFHYPAAVVELHEWGASKSLIWKNDRALRRHGLKLPFEHIMTCRK